MRVLIDSSVLIAAARSSETHHARAAAVLEASAGELGVPVTILAETMSFLGARLGVEQQRLFWDAFMASGIEVVAIDSESLEIARAIDARYADAGFGFADCTLLAACEQHRIAKVLTFDVRLAAFRPSFAAALEIQP